MRRLLHLGERDVRAHLRLGGDAVVFRSDAVDAVLMSVSSIGLGKVGLRKVIAPVGHANGARAAAHAGGEGHQVAVAEDDPRLRPLAGPVDDVVSCGRAGPGATVA